MPAYRHMKYCKCSMICPIILDNLTKPTNILICCAYVELWWRILLLRILLLLHRFLLRDIFWSFLYLNHCYELRSLWKWISYKRLKFRLSLKFYLHHIVLFMIITSFVADVRSKSSWLLSTSFTNFLSQHFHIHKLKTILRTKNF